MINNKEFFERFIGLIEKKVVLLQKNNPSLMHSNAEESPGDVDKKEEVHKKDDGPGSDPGGCCNIA